MTLFKENIRYINTVTHEGKVLIFATASDGQIYYSVKQDGFENTAMGVESEGWEDFKKLELPEGETFKHKNEEGQETTVDYDPSVEKKERKECTCEGGREYVLRSRYNTAEGTAVAPVQLVSGMDHIYVFRPSKSGKVWVDRFVLDSMKNVLTRKLDVRFKRSRQKYQPIEEMKLSAEGKMQRVDSLDFKDINNKPFYEPTTELSLIPEIQDGWFSVVLTPTAEQDKYRWHIFAYDRSTGQIELITLRSSEEGLFEIKDHWCHEKDAEGRALYRSIPGVLRQTLALKDKSGNALRVTHGFSAVKYDVQRERVTKGGPQWVRDACKLMLAVPTDQGVATLSFSIAADGTLSQLTDSLTTRLLRKKERDVLLPLNLLDEIKPVGDLSPTPQGAIVGMSRSIDRNTEDRVRIKVADADQDKLAKLESGELVEIEHTKSYDGLYAARKIDDHTFEVESSFSGEELGVWKRIEKEEGGLIFDGMVTEYERMPSGKLRVKALNHGLNHGDQVQLTGTSDYNGRYPILKRDDETFTIERLWVNSEAVNIKLESLKRRGMVFDGKVDHVKCGNKIDLANKSFTVEAWAKRDATSRYHFVMGQGAAAPNQSLHVGFRGTNKFTFAFYSNDVDTKEAYTDTEWHHWACTYNSTTKKRIIYRDGVLAGEDTAKAHYQGTGEFFIGRCGYANNFDGSIADVRIWNKVRTAEEIRNSMHLMLTGREQGLVGYWRLGGIAEDDDGCHTVFDFSVEARHGVVHGNPYAGGMILQRTLGDGKTKATKYTNDDLFAVTEGAQYVETFEFKTDCRMDPNHADDRESKIFSPSCWGKARRGAEEKQAFDPIDDAFEFTLLDKKTGWWKATCRFIIPEGVRLLRCFDVKDVTGNWETLEIRRHHIRLLSDTVTQALYREPSLDNLKSEEVELKARQKKLAASFKNLTRTIADRAQQKKEIERLTLQLEEIQTECDSARSMADGIDKEHGTLYEEICKRERCEIWDQYREASQKLSRINERLSFALRTFDDGLVDFQDPQYTPTRDELLRDERERCGYDQAKEELQRVRKTYDLMCEQLHRLEEKKRELMRKREEADVTFFKCMDRLKSARAQLDAPRKKFNALDASVKEEESKEKLWETEKTRLQARLREIHKTIRLLPNKQAWLAPLTDQQADLSATLETLETLESNEACLIQQKKQLELRISLLKSGKLQNEVNAQRALVQKCRTKAESAEKIYHDRKDSICYNWCKLEAAHSNKVVHIQNIGKKYDYNVVQHRWYGGVAQKWRFEEVESGWYKIIVKENGYVLDVRGLSKNDGAHIHVCPWENGDNQKWRLHLGYGGGSWGIQCKHSEKYLNVPGRNMNDGINLIQYRSSNHRNAIFRVKVVEKIPSLHKKEEWDEAKQKWQVEQGKLDHLENLLAGKLGDESELKKQLSRVNQQITEIRQSIAEYTTAFNKAVGKVHNNPQQLASLWKKKESETFGTTGALLSFAKPSSRVQALESCQGEVQLNYFDRQGMRQTRYDCTYDSDGKGEQWLPDTFRTCLEFHQSPLSIPSEAFSSVGEQITVEFWARTGDKLPDASYFLEAKNDQSQRILRISLPYNDSRDDDISGVVWDAGDSGKHCDRIFKAWDGNLYDWNHWAFTKDAKKGEMKIFLNGKLWCQNTTEKPAPDTDQANSALDTKKTAFLGEITTCILGAYDRRKAHWHGRLSELRIWDVALGEAEIETNSKIVLSGNEPGLVAYYPMNEAQGNEARDHSINNHHLNLAGVGTTRKPCSAPIGKTEPAAIHFDKRDDYIQLSKPLDLFSSSFTVSMWVKVPSNAQGRVGVLLGDCGLSKSGSSFCNLEIHQKGQLRLCWGGDQPADLYGSMDLRDDRWHFITFVRDKKNGKVCTYVDAQLDREHSKALVDKQPSVAHRIGCDSRKADSGTFFEGSIAEIRIWKKARTAEEIRCDMRKQLKGNEPGLLACWLLNDLEEDGAAKTVVDLAGKNRGTVYGEPEVNKKEVLVCAEYSRMRVDAQGRKSVVMNRLFAMPDAAGVQLFEEKRIEELDLKWIGNAQIEPTLLGYIEGAPPVPSENLTVLPNYNGATSVELIRSSNVNYSWTREQKSGLGASLSMFLGVKKKVDAIITFFGTGVNETVFETKSGFVGDLSFDYSFLNASTVSGSSSTSVSDKLKLVGSEEQTAKFPHLSRRFIPKNVGYALVISGMADVFVSALKRSGKMVGYQVQPIKDLPLDVNTVTFLMNPAYTMNGSLDGLTGSQATSERFHRHVPEMRAQYGSLYPASYFRLKEAYQLKQQIEYQDKQREAYFKQFDARLVDQTSLDAEIDQSEYYTTDATSGGSPLQQLENKISRLKKEKKELEKKDKLTDREEAELEKKENELGQAESARDDLRQDEQDAKAKEGERRQREISKCYHDPSQRAQASDSFAGWQRKMENLQVLAGKRNIVNTYVWDGDGGMHKEQQQFANTVQHNIGGSFNMNAALGGTGATSIFNFAFELTAQATVHLTQTMSKTESREKGFELQVDLSGVEHRGVTDHNDHPIQPGEKVDRYRFMSFYLENNTDHFNDFFDYVVDPEWLQSNDEEARTLRLALQAAPNKVWRVLHRVTYVERPALMGFGKDLRSMGGEEGGIRKLFDRLNQLEKDNQEILAILKKKQ